MTWASDGARDRFNLELEGLRTAATKDVIRRETDTSRENVGYGGRRSRLDHTGHPQLVQLAAPFTAATAGHYTFAT